MNELIKKINNFYTVVESWLSSMWDMFFSNTPANVPVKKLKSDGTIQTVNIPNRAKVWQALEPCKTPLNIETTAATGSITSSSGVDKVVAYLINLSSSNAASPSTSIIAATTKTDFSTPVSLSGFYPMETVIQEAFGWDDAPLNFAKIIGGFLFANSTTGKRGYLDLELGHNAGEEKAVSNFSFGYNELHPEYSIMQILVAEIGANTKVWIKPPSSPAVTTRSDLKVIL